MSGPVRFSSAASAANGCCVVFEMHSSEEVDIMDSKTFVDGNPGPETQRIRTTRAAANAILDHAIELSYKSSKPMYDVHIESGILIASEAVEKGAGKDQTGDKEAGRTTITAPDGTTLDFTYGEIYAVHAGIGLGSFDGLITGNMSNKPASMIGAVPSGSSTTGIIDASYSGYRPTELAA